MNQNGQLPTWLIIVSAFLIAILVAGFFSFLMNRISEKEILVLEQKLEQQIAKDLLKKFMEARIKKNQDQAIVYFTENAWHQHSENAFNLINNFQSYEILKVEQIGGNKFKFAVKIQEKEKTKSMVEIISVIKILDQYFIDSIELAG